MAHKYQYESRKHSNFFANVTNTGFTKFGDRFANVTIGKDLTHPKYKDLNVPMYKDLSFFPVLQDGNCALSAIMCQMAEYSHLNFHEKIDFGSLNLNSSKKNNDALNKEILKKEIQFGIRSIMCDIYEFILHNCRVSIEVKNEYKQIPGVTIHNPDPIFTENVIKLESDLSNFKNIIGYKGDDNYLIDSIEKLYNNINPIIEEKIYIYNSFEKAFDNYKEEMLNEESPLYLNESDILLLSLIFNCPISIFFYEKQDGNILFRREELFKPPKDKKKEESKIIRIGIKTGRKHNGTSITQSHYDAILVRPKEYTDTFHGKIEQIPRSDDALLHAICRAYKNYSNTEFRNVTVNDFKKYFGSDNSKEIMKKYFISDDIEKMKDDINNDIHVYGTYEFEYEILAEFMKSINCNISFYKASDISYKMMIDGEYPIIHILHFDDAIITGYNYRMHEIDVRIIKIYDYLNNVERIEDVREELKIKREMDLIQIEIDKLGTILDAGPPSIQRDFAVIYPIEKIPNELEMQKREIIDTENNDKSRKIIGKRSNEIAANTGGPNNLSFDNIIDSRQIMMNRIGEKEKEPLEKLPIEEETKKDIEELQNYIYKGRLNEKDIYYPATEKTEKFRASNKTKKMLKEFKENIKRKMTRKRPIFRRLFARS